ncbi:MAG: helix-turn-helix domain-containing protein [Peptoniphilaceae bacterium]|nr:helix-turn-helix domain-containing protein [Peptoniphilaceae bacterium]MDY6019249.1 helix-turn-helix domain-containing protein [Anaerococcus sp.]
MRYYLFSNKLTDFQKEKLALLFHDQVYENYIIVRDIDDEKILANFFYEENIKLLIATNMTYLEKYLLEKLNNYKNLIYTSYDLAILRLMKKDKMLINRLVDNFSILPDYIQYDLYKLYNNSLNKLKTSQVNFLHRNTLNYRLKQAYNLTGYDFSDLISLGLFHLYYIVQSEQDILKDF